ncbi:MAG: glycogen-binding domain-containing protein [Candidatus Omnitrophica bacterium]|nr:glycogen-binding domain-containing protein [Candidatus Omnitrophota bacterium]MBU1870048.1 glycogen-binding domain-containing protein [Candidatus Omnitrophota bacterium]
MARTAAAGKAIQLKINAPKAKRVSVAGSFNNWDDKSFSAKKNTKGEWAVKLNLKPGKYEYKFVVDGSWVTDPKSKCQIFNSMGTQNSILEVK